MRVLRIDFIHPNDIKYQRPKLQGVSSQKEIALTVHLFPIPCRHGRFSNTIYNNGGGRE